MILDLKGIAILVVVVVAILLIAWLNSFAPAAPSISAPRFGPTLVPAPISTAVPAQAIESSNHANAKHGWLLAQSIVDCITKNGPHMGMKFRDKNGRFYIPCQLQDGSIGLGIFDKDGNNISAYVPGDGSWEHVKNYILQRAARFTGPLPW